MTEGAEAAGLPRTLPLFPLAGALLLPHGSLPLHVFEPRYLAMVRDARDGAGMIGMVQPTASDPSGPHPPVYEIGCAGSITRESRTEDGRRFVTLTGVCRFDIAAELPLYEGYRRADVRYDRFTADLAPSRSIGLDTAPLVQALRAYFDARGFGTNWGALEELPAEALVNLLAMTCPFEPAEKQALLEAETTKARAQVLAALLQLDSMLPTASAPVQ